MSRATSLGYLGAIACLATGCVEGALAPPDDALDVAEEVVTPNVASRDDLLRLWQLPPADAWAPYEKVTLLAALSGTWRATLGLPRLEDQEVRLPHAAAARVAADGVPPDAMWVVDLQGPASVVFGAALSREARERVAIVPTFNNWPAANELIPAERTLSAMAQFLPRLPVADGGPTIPVFLFGPSWRLAFKDDTIDDQIVDNRYLLTPSDFPSPAELLSRGILHVVYVVPDEIEAQYEEDDLNELFLGYQEAGIAIHMVGLLGLTGGAGRSVFWSTLAIGSRPTVVRDRRFFRRAHGGFGGVHSISLGSEYVFGPSGGHGRRLTTRPRGGSAHR